jgi:wobble nucleotide-excising tRNase
MIKKISKLENFGIFHKFTWVTELSDCKKFNLIYGWNRSGKTTISRIFASCEKKCVYDKDRFKQYPENGIFELETSDGTSVKNTYVDTNVLPVKVFNQDFIDENISFDPSDSCNPIVYVSEEDIENKNKLEKLRQNRIDLNKAWEEAKKDCSSKEKTKETFLTDLGREISNALFNKAYNRTKAENRINSIGIDNFGDKILSDEDKKKNETIIRRDAWKTQNTLFDFKLSFYFDGEMIDDFQKIYEKIKKLLGKEVISETLERLKNDQILNSWVKQGFDLYKTKANEGKCLFCQKPLDNDFLDILSKHFSKDYEELQNAIIRLKNEVLEIKKIQITEKNDELYPTLKDEYADKAKELNGCIEKINSWIDEAVKKLNEKYNNPLAAIANPEIPEDFLSSYNQHISEINKIFLAHNEKAGNHTNEVSTAREMLELHLIAVALSYQDYKKMVADIEETTKNEKMALETFNKNESEISELERKTSNIARAIEEINKHLKEFFGREEIKLELDKNKKGYVIRRDGLLAKNLSEGEKTAIAFSYFIVKVSESGFDKTKGIIFIDDPISSFDSNFIYHCYSVIKEHFKEVEQLFISTHNFQFFNLAKEWFVKKNERIEDDNKKLKLENKPEKPIPCGFFMVENFIESDVRKAKIVKLSTAI